MIEREKIERGEREKDIESEGEYRGRRERQKEIEREREKMYRTKVSSARNGLIRN